MTNILVLYNVLQRYNNNNNNILIIILKEYHVFRVLTLPKINVVKFSFDNILKR